MLQPNRQIAIANIVFLLALAVPSLAEEAPTQPCTLGNAISGRTLFQDNCTVCHGPDGKGGGPLAAALQIVPPDLTLLSKRGNGHFPAEHVIAKMETGGGQTKDGNKAMPVWGKIFAHECGAAYSKQAVLKLERFVETIQEGYKGAGEAAGK